MPQPNNKPAAKDGARSTPAAAPTPIVVTPNATTSNTTNATASNTTAPSASPTGELELFNRYMGAVAVSHGMFKEKKISEVDLHNVREVIISTHGRKEEIQKLGLAKIAYKDISDNLLSAMQTQLGGPRGINTDYADEVVSYDPGMLSFQGTMLYLRSEPNNTHLVLSSNNDKTYTYQYIMFRYITAVNNKKYNLEPNFKTSFEPTKTTYGMADIVKKFKYKDASKADTTDTKLSFEIFKANVENIETVIKNVFSRYEEECFRLRDTSEENRVKICTGIARTLDPDGANKYFTCFEVFQLTEIADFCVKKASDFDFGMGSIEL